MSRNLSRVALTVALFAGMWGFSSCSQQDSSPKTEILNPGKYSQIPLSLDVEAVLQPLAESSPRAVSLELDDSKKKFPKLKYNRQNEASGTKGTKRTNRKRLRRNEAYA